MISKCYHLMNTIRKKQWYYYSSYIANDILTIFDNWIVLWKQNSSQLFYAEYNVKTYVKYYVRSSSNVYKCYNKNES